MLWQHSIKNTVLCECYGSSLCVISAVSVRRPQYGGLKAKCRKSAEGATSGHGPHESRKKPAPHLFLSGLCDTVGVNYREKTTHIPLASFTQMWQEEDRRVDPTPCSFRKDGEMKRREGCWLDGWSYFPLRPLSCFMMLVSFCAMLMWSTGEEEWRLSNPPFLPQIWYCWSKTDTCPHLCVFLCAYLNSWCHNDPSLTLHIYGII